jgi:glutaminyl-peptide cyclotransferase
MILFLFCLTLAQAAYAGKKISSFTFLKTTKAPIYSITVKNIYPHDPEAFTQGLIYYGGVLYESTGRYGESSLRKVEIKTGKIIKAIKLTDEYFGEGIAIFDNKIYQLTWMNETGFIYDLSKLKKISKFSYQGEGWGITADDKYLYMSNGTAVISCLDPQTLKVIRKINVHDGQLPVVNINELEFIRGELWANIFMEDIIVRISPVTGKVLGWIDLSPLYSLIPQHSNIDVLNGIAYDKVSGRIFVTGKYWPYIFEIKLASQH